MNAKKYCIIFMVVTSVCLTLFAAFIYLVDPFLYYRYPMNFGISPTLDYGEKYKIPGIEKNMKEYQSVILGSSMSRNFETEWFDEGYNTTTIKLTNSASTIEHYDLFLTLCDDDLEYVFANLDLGSFRPDYLESEMPMYLYDDNIINDTKYLLDKYALSSAMYDILQTIIGDSAEQEEGYKTELNRYTDYGEEQVLKSLTVTLINQEIQQNDVSVEQVVQERLEILVNLINERSTTKFEFYISPYSIIYWLERYTLGELDNDLYNMAYFIENLVELSNVTIYFPGNNEMISNLDEYADWIHFSPEVQESIYESMVNKEDVLTKENFQSYLNQLYEFVVSSLGRYENN